MVPRHEHQFSLFSPLLFLVRPAKVAEAALRIVPASGTIFHVESTRFALTPGMCARADTGHVASGVFQVGRGFWAAMVTSGLLAVLFFLARAGV